MKFFYLKNLFIFRVKLSKRIPAQGRPKVANLRLVQRYRSFNNAEEKTQVDEKKYRRNG